MEAIGLDLGGNINYLQDLAVTSDGSNLLDIIDQNVPGYHRVTKTDPFQDPLDDEPFCCMHRQHLLTSACGVGGGLGSVTSAMCETASLDLSPNITEDFQKMYSDWQQHLGSLQASEEEDLVVDEVVSLSMGREGSGTPRSSAIPRNRAPSGNPRSSAIPRSSAALIARQRSESVSSIMGPCIHPDLLLDTSRHQTSDAEDFDEVEEENILTEIAGIFDGDLPLEDEGTISAPLIKVRSDDFIDVEVQEGEASLQEAEEDEVIPILDENELLACLQTQSEEVKESGGEAETVNSEKEHIGGGFKNVAELIGNRSQSLVCKKIKSKEYPLEKAKKANGKLPAGSIILAVVNESGSLVPLPQLPVKGHKLARSMKVEASPEKVVEEEIDVETVTEKAPVLEAGDVDSLLAQFEASEAVNTPSVGRAVAKGKSGSVSQSVAVLNAKNAVRPVPVSGSASSQASPQGSPTHQKIKDALPKEIIEKIKASTKRKSTQMLTEPPMLRKGRILRQQESNQHNRHKSNRAAATTPSVQQNTNDQRVPPPLDHDYCFTPDKQKKSKAAADNNAQAGDYLNKLPDYFTFKVSKKDNKKAVNSSDDNHDDSGKKDSGVESGDVSDASVETEDRRKEARTSGKVGPGKGQWGNSVKSEIIEVVVVDVDPKSNEDIYNKLPPYMTDIGNAKPKEEEPEEQEEEEKEEECEDNRQHEQEVKKIKRKLNLSEYRQRIQSAHSSRCPSPAQTDGGQKFSNGNPLSLGDLIQKMKDAEGEKPKESECETQTKEDSAAPSEDVEEGELKGESDTEMAKPVADIAPSAIEKEKETQAPFTSPSSLSSSHQSCRESRKSNSQGYASRRWSSSSHSRSRSRSPNVKRKHHSSRYRRSSRGKRRGARRRSRSSGGSSCRCYSRSKSRTRSRSCSRSRRSCSSDSSYCSSCSDSSRSRSRSHSSKKRERKSYSRKYSGNWERRRRSRSWSRSSSRYSRGRRSRSPSWRSRSPSRISARPRRMIDENRVKQVEERRVIYVGRISEGTTKAELRKRFQKYGSIVDISVHFRDHGDNYGFVTFKNKDEAYNALQKGNEDPSYPRYDLCFGGRRAFCRVQYSDLDAQDELPSYVGGGKGGGGGGSSSSSSGGGAVPVVAASSSLDFDSLLRAAMKRKTR